MTTCRLLRNWRFHLLLWWQAKSPSEHVVWLYQNSSPVLLLLILLAILVRWV